MAATYYAYSSQISSQRSLAAMGMAVISAIVLSQLYVKPRYYDRRYHGHYYESKWCSGFVLPMVLAGLIIAIRTASSSSSSTSNSVLLPSDPSWVLRIGGSSWGLGGVLVLLMLVLHWQSSVEDFFWR